MYTQNPGIGHYSAVFRHVQNLVQRLHMQKPGILGILEYSEPFHNCIPTHIQNPVIFKTRHISRTISRFKMAFFAKIVKNYNYFSRVLHLRYLTDLWISLSLNKYSLFVEWPRAMYYMMHIQNLVYYRKFRHIQAYVRPIQTYSTILWHIWNPV